MLVDWRGRFVERAIASDAAAAAAAAATVAVSSTMLGNETTKHAQLIQEGGRGCWW